MYTNIIKIIKADYFINILSHFIITWIYKNMYYIHIPILYTNIIKIIYISKTLILSLFSPLNLHASVKI